MDGFLWFPSARCSFPPVNKINFLVNLTEEMEYEIDKSESL